MTFLRTMRALILGETWIVPLGVGVVVAAGLALHSLAHPLWHHAGAALLAAGVVAVLATSTRRSG